MIKTGKEISKDSTPEEIVNHLSQILNIDEKNLNILIKENISGDILSLLESKDFKELGIETDLQKKIQEHINKNIEHFTLINEDIKININSNENDVKIFFEKYLNFKNELRNINGKNLFSLTEQEMKEMGLNLGQRKKLNMIMEQLRKKEQKDPSKIITEKSSREEVADFLKNQFNISDENIKELDLDGESLFALSDEDIYEIDCLSPEQKKALKHFINSVKKEENEKINANENSKIKKKSSFIENPTEGKNEENEDANKIEELIENTIKLNNGKNIDNNEGNKIYKPEQNKMLVSKNTFKKSFDFNFRTPLNIWKKRQKSQIILYPENIPISQQNNLIHINKQNDNNNDNSKINNENNINNKENNDNNIKDSNSDINYEANLSQKDNKTIEKDHNINEKDDKDKIKIENNDEEKNNNAIINKLLKNYEINVNNEEIIPELIIINNEEEKNQNNNEEIALNNKINPEIKPENTNNNHIEGINPKKEELKEINEANGNSSINKETILKNELKEQTIIENKKPNISDNSPEQIGFLTKNKTEENNIVIADLGEENDVKKIHKIELKEYKELGLNENVLFSLDILKAQQLICDSKYNIFFFP